MIGVSVHDFERRFAEEFFELCKTPWEFFENTHRYDAILSTTGLAPASNSPLVLLYNGTAQKLDDENEIAATVRGAGIVLNYLGKSLPIYGSARTFPQSASRVFPETISGESAIHATKQGDAIVVRIGYDLFDEIKYLLSTGQPTESANSATLEMHVQLLRELVTRAGLPFVEIPPRPGDRNFIVCLTHDIDHPILSNHCADHTMSGFLYRATIGSLLNASRRRISLTRMFRNWAAAVRLPLVYLGLARDFWDTFDRYLQIESGMGATYFFIPQRNNPGRKRQGPAPAKRASRYTIAELKPHIERIRAAGNEIGLHGLNAWLDFTHAIDEWALIAEHAPAKKRGVRMHWLYYDDSSPAALDNAGFFYDSTVGYNQTIGYRAGTTQVYRPPGVKHLLELPLHIMDTALFYPDYLNLTEDEAYQRVMSVVDDFSRFGGVMTINWHDRSIAPERLWGEFYSKLIGVLKERDVWFATASKAVSWFHLRRAAKFESVTSETGIVHVRASLTKLDSTLPGLRIRVHRPHPRRPAQLLSDNPDTGYVDAQFNESIDLRIAL